MLISQYSIILYVAPHNGLRGSHCNDCELFFLGKDAYIILLKIIFFGFYRFSTHQRWMTNSAHA